MNSKTALVADACERCRGKSAKPNKFVCRRCGRGVCLHNGRQHDHATLTALCTPCINAANISPEPAHA